TKRSRSSMMPVSLQTIAGPPGCQRTVTYVNGPFRYLSIRVGHLPGISPTRGEIGWAQWLPKQLVSQPGETVEG
ncbi:hypothetical protein, partial [Rhizobium laguerreae]|uniref:hypothetical protein n=1 Tax=Rhizobium laguerreae TaxID=1076926 RepID=UPI001C910FAD